MGYPNILGSMLALTGLGCIFGELIKSYWLLDCWGGYTNYCDRIALLWGGQSVKWMKMSVGCELSLLGLVVAAAGDVVNVGGRRGQMGIILSILEVMRQLAVSIGLF